MRTSPLALLALLVLAAAAPPPHGRVGAPADPAEPHALEALRRYEAERRAATDFATLPSSEGTQGADPYRIAPLPDGSGYVGLLRGRNAMVLLDGGLREVQRVSVGPSPSGLAVVGDRVHVGAELLPRVDAWRLAGRRVDTRSWQGYFAGAFLRDLAPGPRGLLYALDACEGDLLLLDDPQAAAAHHGLAERIALPRGPVRLARAGNFLVVDCLLDHCLVVFPLDAYGLPRDGEERRIGHDGPIWCFHAVPEGDTLWIAAGGVEDHPLDRSLGFFGNLDSFVYLYRVDGMGVERLAEINVSELGVVTPKGIHLERGPGRTRVTVAGAGGFTLATLSWPGPPSGVPAARLRAIPPGSADLVQIPGGWALPNPLLDAWVQVTEDTFRVVEVPSLPRRDPLERLGEVLFSTTLMAPANPSEGPRSRFTCETCHFEGGIDGRVHWTGRDSVFASTKPLRGLFNNKPHFSRALDPDLTTMVHNEFRVAGAASGTDPWFPLGLRPYPGLDLLGELPEVVSPDTLRLALLRFLMAFTPRPNARALTRFTPEEREVERAMGRGAIVFRDRCAGCHRARLIADDPASEVPFEEWPAAIFSPQGAIVWASGEIHRTGVTPYVREEGARVPSLRRISEKYPYFTNGSARSLGDVLARARWVGGTFLHDGAPPGAPAERLSEWERVCLLAFLRFL
jgi:hypothetical protein